MFEEDYARITKEVLRYPDLETGGDLFGLWTSEERGLNPLIHIVLGPGTGCKRTKYSFHQHIPYLQQVGSLLTNDFMLGHIGEWHSHHQLTLFEPSSGDYSTVRRNYPSGFHGFLLIIANILPNEAVSLSPFLFRESSERVERGHVVLLKGSSPFRVDDRINRRRDQGAEGKSIIPEVQGNVHEKNIIRERENTTRTTTPINCEVATLVSIETADTPTAVPGKTSGSNGGEGATSLSSPDTHMPPEYWYNSPECNEKLEAMLSGLQGIMHTDTEKPLSVSFSVASDIGKEKLTKVLSMFKDVVGEDRITLAFAFQRGDRRWTVRFPADHPRSAVTLRWEQIGDQSETGRVEEEEIRGDDIRELTRKIRNCVLMSKK